MNQIGLSLSDFYSTEINFFCHITISSHTVTLLHEIRSSKRPRITTYNAYSQSCRGSQHFNDKVCTALQTPITSYLNAIWVACNLTYRETKSLANKLKRENEIAQIVTKDKLSVVFPLIYSSWERDWLHLTHKCFNEASSWHLTELIKRQYFIYNWLLPISIWRGIFSAQSITLNLFSSQYLIDDRCRSISTNDRQVSWLR